MQVDACKLIQQTFFKNQFTNMKQHLLRQPKFQVWKINTLTDNNKLLGSYQQHTKVKRMDFIKLDGQAQQLDVRVNRQETK